MPSQRRARLLAIAFLLFLTNTDSNKYRKKSKARRLSNSYKPISNAVVKIPNESQQRKLLMEAAVFASLKAELNQDDYNGIVSMIKENVDEIYVDDNSFEIYTDQNTWNVETTTGSTARRIKRIKVRRRSGNNIFTMDANLAKFEELESLQVENFKDVQVKEIWQSSSMQELNFRQVKFATDMDWSTLFKKHLTQLQKIKVEKCNPADIITKIKRGIETAGKRTSIVVYDVDSKQQTKKEADELGLRDLHDKQTEEKRRRGDDNEARGELRGAENELPVTEHCLIL